MKTDGHLGRCHLKGREGDAINVILTAVGHNLRRVLAWLRASLALIQITLRLAATHSLALKRLVNGRRGNRYAKANVRSRRDAMLLNGYGIRPPAGRILDFRGRPPVGPTRAMSGLPCGRLTRSRNEHWPELLRQRESEDGPLDAGERETDEDCIAEECDLGCGDLGRVVEACSDGGGAVDDIFSLISSSAACTAAIFWIISSCLATSWSTLRCITSRLNANGASCCIGLEGVVAAGDCTAETGNNQASAGKRTTAISFAASPYDCQASVPPMPMSIATTNRIKVRNIRLPIERQLSVLRLSSTPEK